MKRILLGTAFAHLALMTAVADEGGSPAGAAAPAPASDIGTKIRPDTASYKTVKTPAGSSTKICGDEVSLALVGAELDETYGFVAKVVGTTVEALKEKYGARNLGQQRMFLGNLIRGAYQGKDAEKKARVEAAFKQHLPSFREAIDARMAKAAEEAQKIKDAKQKEKDDAKAKKEADKKAAAAKRAEDAAAKAGSKPAEAKPAAAATAKPAAAPAAAKPSSPAQPK